MTLRLTFQARASRCWHCTTSGRGSHLERRSRRTGRRRGPGAAPGREARPRRQAPSTPRYSRTAPAVRAAPLTSPLSASGSPWTTARPWKVSDVTSDVTSPVWYHIQVTWLWMLESRKTCHGKRLAGYSIDGQTDTFAHFSRGGRWQKKGQGTN